MNATTADAGVTFSLVLCTVGRGADVIAAFFDSLLRQGRDDYEVILVDQNDDDRCVPLAAAYAGRFPLRHVRSRERGLSRARNLGLKFVTGGLIGFPDDDCVYYDHYLNRVAELFDADPSLGGITGYPTAAASDPAIDWRAEPMPLDRFSILNRCQEFTIFLRRSAVDGVRFNDALGVGSGTPWGADEGPDFLMRVEARGSKLVFYRHLFVYHPDKVRQITPATLARSISYARGRGALFRIHGFPLKMIASGLVRPAGGAAVYAVRGQFMRARYYGAIVAGTVQGLCMRPAELKRLKATPLTAADTAGDVMVPGSLAPAGRTSSHA